MSFIALTRHAEGHPPTKVLVNADRIILLEPAYRGSGSSVATDAGSLHVRETVDEILALINPNRAESKRIVTEAATAAKVAALSDRITADIHNETDDT